MPNALRRIGLAAAATILVTALPACGDSDADAAGTDPAATGSDQKITVYSGRNEELMKPLFEQFTAATGIAVEARYAGTAAMAAQLLEEGDRSPADVFLAQDAGALGAVAKAGLFEPLPAEVTDLVPAEFRSSSGEWVGVTGRVRVLAYNPEQVAESDLPASVYDLTGPQWKGKVGVAPTNASFQAFVTAIVVRDGEDKARDFLTGLAANEPQIRDGNGAIMEDVEAGRIAVGLVNHYYLGEIAKERGVAPEDLNLKLHYFPGGDLGSLVNVAGIGVLKPAAADPDVRRFVDYLLSVEGQTYFAEQTNEYPVIDGAPAPGYAPALDSLTVPSVDLNDLDDLESTIALIQASGLVP